jgi:GT2 family glycosyltransferase
MAAVAPSASVILPTRQRRDYLAVALASVAGQVREHGAELLVVEDDPADPATEALAASHGATYLAHGEPRGLNAARNTAARAAASDLLCFLDDDVDAWPTWLGALLRAERACPEHLVFGGPIRARLEGTNLRACGREPPPVTTLDLGPEDRDADFAWGANLSVRRRALDLVGGGFDETLDLYGDEEDLQRRLRAAGGRVRYVAGAGVDHRRAGADARIRGLSRAAYHRGRNSRRYDGRKGSAPPVAAELRTLAGCVAHIVRYRCGNGIVLTAHTAGRLREALGPPPPPAPGGPDYVSGESGTLNRRTRALGLARDAAADARGLPAGLALRRAARRVPPRRRVLVVSVARPEHAATTAAAVAELERSRHEVELALAAPAPGAGKWANVNLALGARDLAGVDWLVIVDDDVVLPRPFLDPFLLVAERFGFELAQPAHAFASNAAWRVTRRRPGAVARRTAFVEIGPVTALHAPTFATLLPFPDLQMGWGLDAHWGAVAAERGWPAGIVDATPVRHLRPVAGDYPREAALAEAEAFLATRPYVGRAEAQRTLATYRTWR